MYRPTDSSKAIVTTEPKSHTSLHSNRVYKPSKTVQPATVASGIPETVKVTSAPLEQTTRFSESDVAANRTRVAKETLQIVPALNATNLCAATATQQIRCVCTYCVFTVI